MCLMLQSLKLLSVMTAVRLDDEADNIENILDIALLNPKGASTTVTDRSITTTDPLASTTWEKVIPATKESISCLTEKIHKLSKLKWKQFLVEMYLIC